MISSKLISFFTLSTSPQARVGAPQQREPITLNLDPYHPPWKETGVFGRNPRLSVER